MDEGVTEGLPTLQSTSGANAHADDDDRYVPMQCANCSAASGML